MKFIIFCFTFFIGNTRTALIPRIIGGENADIKDFPYQASLRVRNYHICGASIIGEKHVLTAAHCITTNNLIVEPYVEVSVTTGTISSAISGDSHRISKITVHPGWKGTLKSSYVNDIAVITLSDKITFNEKQQKVKLPSDDVVTGTDSIITGWGTTSEKIREPSIRLQKLKMTILDNSDCQSQHKSKIYKSQLCAYHSIGHSPCLGDSGGPLVDDINQLVGIISWQSASDCIGYPEVFTNIYAHRAFIESVINE